MAQVRVLVKSFLNNSLVEEGAIIEYDGEIADNVELVKEEKSKKSGKKGAAAPVDSADEQQPQEEVQVFTPVASATGEALVAEETVQVVSQEQAGE